MSHDVAIRFWIITRISRRRYTWARNHVINLSNLNKFSKFATFSRKTIWKWFLIFFLTLSIQTSQFFDLKKISTSNQKTLWWIWWKYCFSSKRRKSRVNEFRAFFSFLKKLLYRRYKFEQNDETLETNNLFNVVYKLTNFYNL